MTTILGIETSCDETAAAIVVDGTDVRSNVVASQVELHRKYGGVVPEIAARAHIERLDAVIAEALDIAGVGPDGIDAIAVTNRPGLVGSLLIGVTAAKTLSWVWNKPLVAVDHVRAHAVSPAIGLTTPPWPAVALVVSGGHTSLYRVDDFDAVTLLGSTIDDAAGEAFDKVALMLGLPYPGGPAVERAAADGDPRAIELPRSLLDRDSLDFSFSGLKTAVLYSIHGQGRTSGGLERLSAQGLADICASFQQAVVEVLVTKTLRAVEGYGLACVVLGGGVAANRALRGALAEACSARGVRFCAAAMPYCIDNGAMIAALGHHYFRRGEFAGLDLAAEATALRARAS